MLLAKSLLSSYRENMPAKKLHAKAGSEACTYVYNKGVEKRDIFNDHEDYEVFVGYLRDYLSAPLDPESTKKTFTVRGRTFSGTPHKLKNYFNKIDLIAYSLVPNRFNLVLHQITPGKLESFIRSLCTRYSIYYNKKYSHSGSLFDGPYKSVQTEDISQLLLLTLYLHRSLYSSYPEYSGERDSSWVKTKLVLSAKGINNYRDYVEKYEPNQKEKDILEKMIFGNGLLERRKVESVPEDALKTIQNKNLKPFSRIPEILASSAVFLVLLGLGLRNINISKAKNLAEAAPTTEPAVLSESTKPAETPMPAAKVVMVKISDGADSANIRQGPTTHSKKIGEAKDGETFEFVSESSGWYEVKLANGLTGFISPMYAFYIEPDSP